MSEVRLPYDICRCHGDGCSVALNCARVLAKPGERSPWFMESPGKDEHCEHYIAVREPQEDQ